MQKAEAIELNNPLQHFTEVHIAIICSLTPGEKVTKILEEQEEVRSTSAVLKN